MPNQYRRVSAALFIFFTSIYTVFSQAAAQILESRRLALLIGNSAYQKNALPNPVNDAHDFGAMLSEAGFFTTVRTDLGLRDMEAAVRDFSLELHEGDIVLVFYAGHGIESGGLNYLIPIDNAGLQSEADLKYKAYAASRILDEVAARKAKFAMLILDACRDNPFPSRSGLGSRGLTVMAAPPQLESLILYSTAPGTTAADGSGRNSVFMRSLLAEIQTPNISVRDVFDRVGGAVKAATGGSQVPWLNSTPLSEPFIFFSGAQAEARATALSASAQSELQAQRAKISELEAARAKAKDDVARQNYDTQLATARALEAAKKLESERLKVESVRLADERKKAEAAAAAKRDFDATEAAKTAVLKNEAAKLRQEYESLVRADDSAPEFIRQINALEKALKEIGDRYEALRKDGEKGIESVYAQKAQAIKASLVMEPWENEPEFQDRTKSVYTDLDTKKSAEVAAYTASITKEQDSQEKELKEKLSIVSSQFSSTVYTQGGTSFDIQVGTFDRDKKIWPINIESNSPDFYFRAKIEYNIASAPDIGAAYRAFDTALKAGALAVDVDYLYSRTSSQKYVPAISSMLRLKDLSTGKVIVAVQQDIVAFYLINASPEQRLARPILKLSGILDGSKVFINNKEIVNLKGDFAVEPGEVTIIIKQPGYKVFSSKKNVLPGNVYTLEVAQQSVPFMEMVPVYGGTFSMGSDAGDNDEKPVHSVTISSFQMGKYEVTIGQYQNIMGSNSSWYLDGDEDPMSPIVNISWDNAVAFCNKLSEREGLQKVYTISDGSVSADFLKNGYRLPTEAEWEYAARGGASSHGYIYSGSSDLNMVAWHIDNSSSSIQPVGGKAPNELGIYDMSGNVREWCWDYYQNKYISLPSINPTGPYINSYRVIRGGGYLDLPFSLRITYRTSKHADDSDSDLSFRVVRRP